MTEIEIHSENLKRIKEYDLEIIKVKELQVTAMKANDNILTKIWADKIKELKAERSQLDGSAKYTRLSIFTQVVKAYLTKEQYDDCWNRVTEVLENPSLMQQP